MKKEDSAKRSTLNFVVSLSPILYGQSVTKVQDEQNAHNFNLFFCLELLVLNKYLKIVFNHAIASLILFSMAVEMGLSCDNVMRLL